MEPLADALGVQVLDLLRGEETDTPEPEMTVRRAIVLLVRQTREKTRRRWGQILGGLIAALMVGFVLFAVLDRTGVFLRDVSLTVTAAVYTADGAPAGETTVTIDGTRKVVGEKSFFGQFAIACVEPTCREEAMAHIRWDAMEVEGWQDIFHSRAGEFLSLGGERMLYITENMQSFGLKLEDERFIATDPEYVPLLKSVYYYSIRPVFGMPS